jgi:hypothetical protein
MGTPAIHHFQGAESSLYLVRGLRPLRLHGQYRFRVRRLLARHQFQPFSVLTYGVYKNGRQLLNWSSMSPIKPYASQHYMDQRNMRPKNPTLRSKLAEMRQRLEPFVSVSSSDVHPRFPPTLVTDSEGDSRQSPATEAPTTAPRHCGS